MVTKLFKLSLFTLFVLMLLGSTGFADSTRLGLGTGVTIPELVSYNTRLLSEFRLSTGNELGITPTVRAEVSPASFIGIQIISAEVSLLLEKVDLRKVTPYLGGGAGAVFINTSVGSDTSITFHGFVGTKFKGLSQNTSSSLIPYVQAGIRTGPVNDYVWEFEGGILFEID